MKKTTMYLDAAELEEAKAELGASSDAETVRLALQAVLRMAASKRMKTFAGTETGPLMDVPRRREPARKGARAPVRAKRRA
jgi:hypothetical protein